MGKIREERKITTKFIKKEIISNHNIVEILAKKFYEKNIKKS